MKISVFHKECINLSKFEKNPNKDAEVEEDHEGHHPLSSDLGAGVTEDFINNVFIVKNNIVFVVSIDAGCSFQCNNDCSGSKILKVHSPLSP